MVVMVVVMVMVIYDGNGDGLDRVLVDGGDRPSRNFPRFHSKQLAILKKDENYQILFGNTLIFPSPVDLLAWSDPIYKKKRLSIHINIFISILQPDNGTVFNFDSK